MTERCASYASYAGTVGLAMAAANAQGLGEVMAHFDLKAGSYDPAAIAAISEYSQSVDRARMTEASENINQWLEVNCPR